MISVRSLQYWLPATALISDMKDPLHSLSSPLIDKVGSLFASPKEEKLPLLASLPDDKSLLSPTVRLLFQKVTLAALMIFSQNRLTSAIKKSRKLPHPSGRLAIAMQSFMLIGMLWAKKDKASWTDRIMLVVSLTGTAITALDCYKTPKYTALGLIVATVAGALLGGIWENFSSTFSHAADMVDIN